MMTDKLLHLEECLRTLNAPVLNYLKPGIEKNELKGGIGQYIQLDMISEDILQLYSWCGGTNIDNEEPAEYFYIFPTYYLNSIDEIALLYEQNNFQLIENKMLPLFSSGKGEILTVDISKGNSSKVFCIQPWNPDANAFTSIYDNLVTMIETVIACYRRNIFYIAQDGLLEMDFEKAWEVSGKMNPESEYWMDF